MEEGNQHRSKKHPDSIRYLRMALNKRRHSCNNVAQRDVAALSNNKTFCYNVVIGTKKLSNSLASACVQR